MTNFKDFAPSQTGWIHDLARAETHPDAERLLGLSSGIDPHQLVEEETIRFLMELRERFTEYCRLFNSFSEGGTRFQEIKIFSVAQTPADFMIFRNQIKLVVTNSAHGVIAIAFTSHQRSHYQFDGADPDSLKKEYPQAQELLAQVGPFRDIKWTFQGEKVDPEQVAKFYFVEFIRTTREKKSTSTQNQILLEQIKALLKDKGVDF